MQSGNWAKRNVLKAKPDIGEIDVTQGRIRVCAICKVSVDEVLAQGCGISLEQCDVQSIRKSIAEKKTRAAAIEKEAKASTEEAQRLMAVIAQIDQEIQTVNGKTKDANALVHAAQKAAGKVQDQVYQAKRILDDVRALQQSTETNTSTPTLPTELEVVRAKLGPVDIRGSHFA